MMIPNSILNLIMKRYNINTNVLQNIKSPDDMAQFLLNSGKVNQDQVNQARQMWGNPQVRQQMQNNPLFSQMMK